MGTDIQEDMSHIGDMDFEDFLEHYGVLGMKWGHRKDEGTSDLDKADKKWEKKGKRSVDRKAYNAANKRAIDALNKDLPKINAKKEYTDYIAEGGNLQDGSPTSFKYNNEINKTYQEHYKRETGPLLESPSGKKKFDIYTNGYQWKVVAVDNVSHAEEDTITFEFTAIPDEDGRIVRMEPKTEITHFVDMPYDEFISHYGVLGMKWGHRRSDKELARARAKSNIGGMSDDQIRQAVNRMNLEKQLNQLMDGKKSSGDSWSKKIAKRAGDAAMDVAFDVAKSEARKQIYQNTGLGSKPKGMDAFTGNKFRIPGT